MSGELRMCVCGHNIWDHEDYNMDIHECTVKGCKCHQFQDDESPAAEREGRKE